MLPGVILLLLPVVVVDVSGDRLDPAHTRELVEKELSVTAVTDDDPRAAQAMGRVEVAGSAKDGTLTVKYRKLDEPVERTIKLAGDRDRAESDAALLAGNLARDEASELTSSEEKEQKKSAPAPSQPLVKWNDSARDLAQMKSFLAQSVEEERSSRTRSAVMHFVAAGAFLAPAVYFFAADSSGSAASSYRWQGLSFSASLIGGGVGQLFGSSSLLEPLEKKIKEHEAKGDDPDTTIADVEHDWAQRAKAAGSARRSTGWLCTVLGSIGVLGGSAIAFAEGADGRYPVVGVSLLAVGTLAALYGVGELASESSVETSYRMWRTVKSEPDTGMRISIGAGPLPGGGGAASFAVTF
jgi:hypothetical protein